MFGLRYLTNVTTLKLDSDLCTGCRMCLDVCPHAVFAMDGRKVKIVDKDACMECGACALNCPHAALHVAAGVGCAAAVISGALRGTAPSCDCGGPGKSSCC